MSSTEIEVRSGGALAVGAEQTEWSEQQLAVLRSVGVDKDVIPAELTAFLHESQRTGLDPFSKQIYLIGRWDGREQRKVFRSQTGIDGYRVVAHRAARRDRVELEYDDTLWCAPDGKWRDVWLENYPPSAAKVVVRKDGKTFPAVATLAEYAALDRNNNPTPMWRKMPATMLAKCAEALALRKAFPHDLSGIYTAEEMEQADARTQVSAPQVQRSNGTPPEQDPWATPGPDTPSVPPTAEAGQAATVPAEAPNVNAALLNKANAALLKAVNTEVGKRVGAKREDRLGLIAEIIGHPIASSSELTRDEGQAVLASLARADEQNKQPAAEPAPDAPPMDDEQLFQDLQAAIVGAPDSNVLAVVYQQVLDAQRGGRLTAGQFAQLDELGRAASEDFVNAGRELAGAGV